MILRQNLNALPKDYPLLNAQFCQHLHILGLSLIAVSIIYLVAANWFMLPQFVQLGIPPFFLLVSSLASIYFSTSFNIRQTLDTISGLMLGLSLAVIGQIYQTGADSYQLFCGWALLLLPWLYRPNIGVFALFSITSILAVILFFDQTFWLQINELICLLSVNIWTALLYCFCIKSYPALRWGFLAWIGILSLASIIAFILRDGWNLGYLILGFLLPFLSYLYFQSKNQSLSSTVSLLLVGINFTLLMVYGITTAFESSLIAMLFACAVVVFSWFTVLTTLLKQRFPHSHFSVIPLAIGAWLAGILLALLMLVAWEEASWILSLIALAISLFGIKKFEHIFAKHFFYCLLICGQVGFLTHLFIRLDNPLSLLITQIILLMIYMLVLKLHWFMLYLQIIALYFITMFNLLEHGFLGFYFDEMLYSLALIITFMTYGLMFITRCINNTDYKKSILLTLLTIFLASLYMGPVNYGWTIADFKAYNPISITQLICAIVWILCSLKWIVRPQTQLNVQLGFLFLSAIVIGCGYFELIPVFFILAWSLKYHQKIIYALCIVSIILYLWMLYYSFDISFLIKSVSLFITGVMLLFFAYQLNNNHKQGETL